MSDGLFDGTVLRTAHVTPHMVRVTLGGDGLRDYASSGRPDESCRLFFPGPDSGHGHGHGHGHDDGGEVRRAYTIRRHDRAACEIDIDFVAHPGGVAAEWALAARPGDSLRMSAAEGQFVDRPADQWLILVGDATALPAVGRIVEGLAPGRPALVIGIVSGPEEEQTFTTAADVEVRWVHVPVEQAGPTPLTTVRGLDLPPQPGYLWACGEAAAQRAVRKYLRHELTLPATAYHTLGYWRHRQEEWEKRLAVHHDVVEPRIEAADKAITDDEEFFDALDEIYDEVGL